MAQFYNDTYNTRYRLFFSDIDGNPKRLDIDQRNYGLAFYQYRIEVSSSQAGDDFKFLYVDIDNADNFVNIEGGFSATITAKEDSVVLDPAYTLDPADFTIEKQQLIAGVPSEGIQNIVGTKNPVRIKYNSGELFKKTILSSKCTINLFKQFDDEFINFHEYPENEFKIRIYNGITPFQYHKLRILCPRAGQEKYPVINDEHNYRERIAAVEDSYICDSDDEAVDYNFDKFATLKNKFINRVVHDNGIIENEDAILSNDIQEVSDPYYQMYWQGFLVANTYKEKLQPYPFQISLQALDMLGAIDNAKITLYGGDLIPASQNHTSSNFGFEKTDATDVLSRYYLRVPDNNPYNNVQTTDCTTYFPDTLYQYFFIEMDSYDDGQINILNSNNEHQNFSGFVDRFTYGATTFDLTTNKNTIGQNGLMDSNYNLKKGKQNIEDILKYKNARIYQSWGQIVIGITGTKNGVLDNTTSMISNLDGNMDMMRELAGDVRAFMKSPISNKRKHFKIAIRNYEYGFTSYGYSKVIAYMGYPAVKQVKSDLQPISKDFSVEYLAPYKGLNIEIDQSLIRRVNGETGKNPSIRTFTSLYNQMVKTNVQRPEITTRLDYYIDCDVSGNIPQGRLYYFNQLDTRNLSTQSSVDFDYFYDQNDRRFEKAGRFNYVELQNASDYNKWNSVNIVVDEWDLYSSQSNDGIQQMRSEIGVLGFVVKNDANKVNAIYCDNFSSVMNMMMPDKQIIQMNATASANQRFYDFKLIPFRSIAERDLTFDFQKVLQSVTNRFTGNVIDRGEEILNLHSAFVHRYEFSCKDKSNNFSMADNVYVNFENYKDDAISYIDGLEIDVKENRFKVICHKGTLHEYSQFDVATFTENSIKE